MRQACRTVAAMALIAVAASADADAQDDRAKARLEKDLLAIEEQIRKAPEEPELQERRAQCLMKLGRHDDGYAAAHKAIELHARKKDDIASIVLETIDAGHLRIDVVFNMGPDERSPPKTGTHRPLSFRVRKKEAPADAPILESLDWEIRREEGDVVASGFPVASVPTDWDLERLIARLPYRTIRALGLDLARRRHPENFDQLDPRRGN